MHQMTPWHVNLPYYYVPSYSEGYVRSRKGFFFISKKGKFTTSQKFPQNRKLMASHQIGRAINPNSLSGQMLSEQLFLYCTKRLMFNDLEINNMTNKR